MVRATSLIRNQRPEPMATHNSSINERTAALLTAALAPVLRSNPFGERGLRT